MATTQNDGCTTPTRWAQLWDRLGLIPPETALGVLMAHYTEPHRAYHNLHHIHECLTHFDDTAASAERPALLELAIWTHDVMYDTRAPDNERQSADWICQQIAGAGGDRALSRTVEGLVLATHHGVEEPKTPDERLLVDIDLAILGARAARFDEYERQIRVEYAWVPSNAFRRGRKRVLDGFLRTPHIYSTEAFRDEFEACARVNIARSLALLG